MTRPPDLFDRDAMFPWRSSIHLGCAFPSQLGEEWNVTAPLDIVPWDVEL